MKVAIAEGLPWSSAPELSDCPPGLFCRKTAEHRISQQENFVMDIKLDDFFLKKWKQIVLKVYKHCELITTLYLILVTKVT